MWRRLDLPEPPMPRSTVAPASPSTAEHLDDRLVEGAAVVGVGLADEDAEESGVGLGDPCWGLSLVGEAIAGGGEGDAGDEGDGEVGEGPGSQGWEAESDGSVLMIQVEKVVNPPRKPAAVRVAADSSWSTPTTEPRRKGFPARFTARVPMGKIGVDASLDVTRRGGMGSGRRRRRRQWRGGSSERRPDSLSDQRQDHASDDRRCHVCPGGR